jgi:uncharacterized membrane protein YsdA (DUF1294 family)
MRRAVRHSMALALAMYLLRHKTQHTRFILVNWIADAVYLVILLALFRQ